MFSYFFFFFFHLHKIRTNDHGLVVWLGLPEWESKDDNAQTTCASNVANMVSGR